MTFYAYAYMSHDACPPAHTLIQQTAVYTGGTSMNVFKLYTFCSGFNFKAFTGSSCCETVTGR